MPQFVVTSDQIAVYTLGSLLVFLFFGLLGLVFKKSQKVCHWLTRAGGQTTGIMSLFYVMAYLITRH